jgi:GxxExxY protein
VSDVRTAAAFAPRRPSEARAYLLQDQRLDCGYRIDLLVEDEVIVEVKSIERIERVHAAQLRSHLQFAKCKVGLLINFNVKWLLEQGVKRVVNGFPE